MEVPLMKVSWVETFAHDDGQSHPQYDHGTKCGTSDSTDCYSCRGRKTVACWNEDKCGVGDGGDDKSGDVIEGDTCCNDVSTNCMGPWTSEGTTRMIALSLTEMMQQRPRCPSDDLGRDGLDLGKSGNLVTLANDAENGFVSSSWS